MKSSLNLFRDSWICATICATWLIDMCDMTHWYVWRDWFLRATWCIHTTHWYVRHESLICYTTHWYVRHNSFTCATWIIHMCNMTHTHIHTHTYTHTNTWRTHIGMQHEDEVETHHTFTCVTMQHRDEVHVRETQTHIHTHTRTHTSEHTKYEEYLRQYN